MKIENFVFLTLLLFALVYFSCCDDDDSGSNCPDSIEFNSELYATYNNPVGGTASLVIDNNQSSNNINIEFEPTISFSTDNSRILINYPAVTIKEGKDVFKIENISTEKETNDCWIVDDENELSWTFSKSLDIVLVLDVSSSLGDNIDAIKNSANEVIMNILGDNPSAQIAVVKFSRGNVNTAFSSTINILTDFISSSSTFSSPDIGDYVLEGRNETALYEAIAKAVELLNASDARGKGILTFTDGVSNFQFDPVNQLPDQIVSDMTMAGIANYTIGFDGNQGGIDKTALETIAINGDFSFPTSVDDLNGVFIRFTNNVAAVYDLIYNTNTAKLTEPISYRFLFKTQKIN